MKTYEQNPSNRWGFARERGKSGYVVTANEGVALVESDFAFPVARKAYRVEIASGAVKALRLGANPKGTTCSFWIRTPRLLKSAR